MKSIAKKIKKALHAHPRLRNGVRWARWQAKKIPGVNRISIAIDNAYFNNAGDERPHADEHNGGDEYSMAYSTYLIPLTHGRVLDVGCGHGYLTQKIAENPAVESVVGVDKIAEFRCLNPKIKYRTNDLTSPEDFPGKFDVIVSSEFIEHISEEDHKKLLPKVIKALNPGAVYIGSTPLNPTHFKTFSGSRFHIREYSQKDLTDILTMFFEHVTVRPLSRYCLVWEAKIPKYSAAL